MTRDQELEQRYQDFQEWLNTCPLVVTDYQDFTDQFQITFNLDADSVDDTFIDINNTGGKY